MGLVIAATPKAAACVAGPIDAAFDARLIRALADPTRLLLLSCIAKCARPCAVGEVAECCSVDLSVVSRHLALLARSGVLEATREGRVVRYGVRYAALAGSLRRMADAVASCDPAGGGCCGGGCGGGGCGGGGCCGSAGVQG